MSRDPTVRKKELFKLYVAELPHFANVEEEFEYHLAMLSTRFSNLSALTLIRGSRRLGDLSSYDELIVASIAIPFLDRLLSSVPADQEFTSCLERNCLSRLWKPLRQLFDYLASNSDAASLVDKELHLIYFTTIALQAVVNFEFHAPAAEWQPVLSTLLPRIKFEHPFPEESFNCLANTLDQVVDEIESR